MKAKILDQRIEENSRCLLCKITLEEYIRSLPSTYQDYDIQREIVENVYLDHLVETVIQKKHIPAIVLVAEEAHLKTTGETAHISSFKILDGLQRTFRLKAIWKTIEYCVKEIKDPESYLAWSKFKLSRHFSVILKEFDSSTHVFVPILEAYRNLGRHALTQLLVDNSQWFEIWVGLSANDVTNKMLTLNAGHKPVKTRHQLELLFLNLLPTLRAAAGGDFRIVREKEVGSSQFSKKRECGSFHFAHIISSLLSVSTGKPVTPSAELIQEMQANADWLETHAYYVRIEFLGPFVNFLVRLDRILFEQYGEIGLLWMGREVILAGLFGSLGEHATNRGILALSVMKQFLHVVGKNPKLLRLDSYEAERNRLDLSKVNIGSANRKAVLIAVGALLSSDFSKAVDWRFSFGVTQ